MPNLVEHMQSVQMAEEQLRPQLPARFPAHAIWGLSAKELLDSAPEVYAGIVKRLSDGDTNARVAKVAGIPIELVRKIRELHPQTIEAGRKATHSRMEEALQSASDQLCNQINAGKIKGSQLAVTFGVLFDKNQIATGGVTQRIERIDVASAQDLQAMFNALPIANAKVVNNHELQNLRDSGPADERRT